MSNTIQTIVVVDRNGDEHFYTDSEENDNYVYYRHQYTAQEDGLKRLVINRQTVACAEFYEPRYIKIFWD